MHFGFFDMFSTFIISYYKAGADLDHVTHGL